MLRRLRGLLDIVWLWRIPVDRHGNRVIPDDPDELDVDAPIPYVLTALGHRDVQELRSSAEDDCPQHEWKFERRGAVCQNCNRWASVGADPSIPAYLRPTEKREWNR